MLRFQVWVLSDPSWKASIWISFSAAGPISLHWGETGRSFVVTKTGSFRKLVNNSCYSVDAARSGVLSELDHFLIKIRDTKVFLLARLLLKTGAYHSTGCWNMSSVVSCSSTNCTVTDSHLAAKKSDSPAWNVIDRRFDHSHVLCFS